ncbi:MAG: exodeoxyribonuclease V subunit alpha [Pseudomonadota bacterium]
MNDLSFPLPGGAPQMIGESFARQARAQPTLATALGVGLQTLRQEGYVAATAERLRQVLSEKAIELDEASEGEGWSTQTLLATGLVSENTAENKPVVLDRGLFYFAVDWCTEQELARWITALAKAEPLPPPSVPADLGLGRDQASALRHALGHRFTVLSGGPGTGKTTLVGQLIRQWLSAGGDPQRLMIAAPTGRAAARLSGAISALVDTPLPPAGTLHRALGWSPSRVRFRFDQRRPIPADLVIVDEVSMADLALMHALFSALEPNAQLVLLGDKDQLVSVQPGSVLADLCAGLAGGTAETCVQTLNENFRYGEDSGIEAVAAAIRDGDAGATLEAIAASDDVELLPALTELEPICADWLTAVADESPEDTWRRLQSKRILCAHRRGPFGIERVNRQVFRWLQRCGQLAGRYADEQANFPGRLFSLTSNQYEEGFFNGDQGFLRSGGGDLTAWLESTDQALRKLSPARLPAAETAYAMTVHRAQGSEFGEVFCVLPPADSPLLTRELLYTAVTRARTRVTLYGDPTAIARAVNNPGARSSGLARRLADLTRKPSDSPIQQSLF